MLKELSEDPESGLLGFCIHPGLRNIMVVQYWRSTEHLQSYARDKSRQHQPAWAAFAKSIGSNGDVGIWHETYHVNAGAYEAIYNNMPVYGLGAAGQLVPATGRLETAAGRLGKSQNSQNGTTPAPIKDTPGIPAHAAPS